MALTLNATAAHASANSYATLAEANTYHEAHLYASTWNDAVNDPTKTQALVMATTLLDRYFTWVGSVSTDTQALRWPRVGAYDRDGRLLTTVAIPAVIRDATAEFARWLIDSDRTAEDSSGEIEEATVGPLKVKYASGTVSDVPVIPDVVVAMLSHVGTYRETPGGAIVMRRA